MINIWPIVLAATPKVAGYNPTPLDRRSPLGWHRFLEVTIGSRATIVSYFWQVLNFDFRLASFPMQDAPLWATGSMLRLRAWRTRYCDLLTNLLNVIFIHCSECLWLQFNGLSFLWRFNAQVSELVANLTSSEWLDNTRAKISDTKTVHTINIITINTIS